MYRLTAIILLIVASLSCTGQTDFCLPGARWLFHGPGSGGPPFQNHFIYTGDTTINGFADVKILKKETRLGTAFPYLYYESKSFFRQTSDSILHFVNGEFQLMFDYDVEVGDIRLVNVGGGLCSEKDTMRIDSISTWNYQGEDLSTYHFSLMLADQLDSLNASVDGYYIGGGLGTYVERIGLMADHPSDLMVECIHGDAIAEYVPADFVCYTDNQLAVNYPDTCNRFLDALEMVQETIVVLQFQNFLQVKNAQYSTLTVYDILGKPLYRSDIESKKQLFNISELPDGILLVVIDDLHQRFTKKVVKTAK